MEKFSVLLFVCLMLTASYSQSEEAKLKITSPTDNQKVNMRTKVVGTVKDSDAVVWVVIHPLETSDYWVQPKVSKDTNATGEFTWKVMAYFGDETSAGKEFEIKAVGNPEADLAEGDVLSDWPEAEYSSELVDVTRK